MRHVAAMSRTSPPADSRADPLPGALVLCIAALAGFVDALAFTSLGGFFAAFMSGNTTRAAAGVATGTTGDALVAGGLILGFVSGGMLAAVIARALPQAKRPAIMAAVTALLVAAGIAARHLPGATALLLLAMAMGLSHLLLLREGERFGMVGGLTGALARLGDRLATALMGDPDRWGWLPHLLLWSGFAAGAVLGAGSQLRFGLHGYSIAAAAAGVLALVFVGLGRRSA